MKSDSCVCVHFSVCVCACVFLFVCVGVRAYMSLCAFVCMHMCVCVWYVYVHVCVSMTLPELALSYFCLIGWTVRSRGCPGRLLYGC